jgi:RNA polymerase sigma-70 factor (ECF subfamily)
MSNAIVTTGSSAARAPRPDPVLDAAALAVVEDIPASGSTAHPPEPPPPPKSGPTLARVPSDRDLVERTLRGDARAFNEIVLRHQKRIFRLTLHMLRDRAEAEDVTQETFVRAYGALARFDGRSEPYTWIYRIAVNLSLNAIRARRAAKRKHAGADGAFARSTPGEDARTHAMEHDAMLRAASPPVDAGQRQLYMALARAVDSLSDTLRTTLILVCVDGRSHEEAAVILGAPEGTIAWRVHEARRKLREAMAERGFDLDQAMQSGGGGGS